MDRLGCTGHDSVPYLSQRAVVYHETGHLVIGVRLGMNPSEILFDSPTSALTVFRPADPGPDEERVMQQLAGILTQLTFVPESITAGLRDAMFESVIFGLGWPLPAGLSNRDRVYRCGGAGDMDTAAEIARLVPDLNECAAVEFQRQAETKIRRMLFDSCVRREIESVAADVTAWLRDEFRPTANSYTGERALSVIEGVCKSGKQNAQAPYNLKES